MRMISTLGFQPQSLKKATQLLTLITSVVKQVFQDSGFDTLD